MMAGGLLPASEQRDSLSPSVPALPCLALPGMPESTLVTVVLLPAASTLKLCPRQQTAGGSPGPSPGPSPGSSPGPDSREDSLASYSHVGCFADMKADRVFGSSMTSNDMSTAVSVTFGVMSGCVFSLGVTLVLVLVPVPVAGESTASHVHWTRCHSPRLRRPTPGNAARVTTQLFLPPPPLPSSVVDDLGNERVPRKGYHRMICDS